MIGALDVDYREDGTAVAGLVLFAHIGDAEPSAEVAVRIPEVEPYVPGALYRRELPCLRAVLDASEVDPGLLIVDANVWLSEAGAPGLGAHLYEALERKVPVIGVAKNRYAGAPAKEVIRGGSARPLYVTAVGLDVDAAAERIRSMAGAHRLPTLLKRVDRLARDAEP